MTYIRSAVQNCKIFNSLVFAQGMVSSPLAHQNTYFNVEVLYSVLQQYILYSIYCILASW